MYDSTVTYKTDIKTAPTSKHKTNKKNIYIYIVYSDQYKSLIKRNSKSVVMHIKAL